MAGLRSHKFIPAIFRLTSPANCSGINKKDMKEKNNEYR